MSIETAPGADGAEESAAEESAVDDGGAPESYEPDPYSDDTAPIQPAPRRRRHRKFLVIAGLVVGGVLVIGVLWLFFTALIARSQLQDARSELPELRAALLAGDRGKAESLASDIRHHANVAQWLVSGPAWWVGARIPYAGVPLKTSKALASAVRDVSVDVLPKLIDMSDVVENPALRQGAGVNLHLLDTLQPLTREAAGAVAKASSIVAAAPHHSWLAGADSAREAMSDQLTQLAQYLAGAQRTLRVALPLLGNDGPQRIFVAFENDAEARGLGGLPAAFAILETDHGQVRFTHFGNDTELATAKANVPLSPGYQASWGKSDPDGTFRNSDISPNFPTAAEIWAGMWHKHSGQHVDAAIAVDPTALSYLLHVTGTAVAADGTKVTASNVVALTESVQYSRFTDRSLRQQWVVSIARAVSDRLLSGKGVRFLGRAVAQAATERRFMVWSDQPKIEKDLVVANYAGEMTARGAPVSSFAVINSTGSKLNYYLDRTMTYDREGCGANGTATATLILTNNAPRSGLPDYVTFRSDKTKPRDAQPGDDHVIVAYYYTAGARATSVQVNGHSRAVVSSTENGLGVVVLDLELKIGVRNTISITTTEPEATEPVDIIAQPLARPMQVVSTGTVCGA